MKKLLLLVFGISMLSSFAQPAGMLNETFRLKSLYIGNTYLTPNGENPNLTIYEVAGDYVLEADGIFNTMNAAASFNGNSMTLNDYGVTLHDCIEPNCYYEDLYFYDVLTNLNLETKTFTFFYSENNGFKFLRLRDTNYNTAYYSTEPAPIANPMLFQTWYLFMQEGDMGDPIFYNGPNPPQITINPDFTYTGIESCATISGDFILGSGDIYLFQLQPQNYINDESNCQPGEAEYALYEIQGRMLLDTSVYEGNDGNDYLSWEYAPGFLSHFTNILLSTSENNFSDLKLFPNPAQNKLFIQSIISDFDSVSITDINGRIIVSFKNMISNEIDVSALKAGMYFLNITSSEGNTTKKFIKN
ncbi:T9SS type A sorting domain-containing protein [Aequorivita flava]|uniref:T9SS type A sorting domain-containing protein n=1 Tax=Aequorivita flava TaxID=3114371 RepID=A0AB35YR76_9FLAO